MPHEPAYRAGQGKTYDPHFSSANRKIDIKAKATDHGRPVTWKEGRAWSKWKKLRISKGWPTWTLPTEDFAHLRGVTPRNTDLEEGEHEEHEIEQAGLLEWCQAFCHSRQPMKEFVLKKEVWGWDEEGIVIGELVMEGDSEHPPTDMFSVLAVRAAIESTGYRHDFSVEFERNAGKVMIHPENLLARMTTQVCQGRFEKQDV
jgi:hypothetical protein